MDNQVQGPGQTSDTETLARNPGSRKRIPLAGVLCIPGRKEADEHDVRAGHGGRYLARVEEALQAQDFSKMTPEFLLQTSLQIRTRLNKMREQMPLRTTPDDQPFEPLPFTGCVSNGNVIATIREDFETEGELAAQKAEQAAPPSNDPTNSASADAAAESNSLAPPAAGLAPSSTSEGRVSTSPKPTNQVPFLPTSGHHANGNGKPHHNGQINGAHNGKGKHDRNGNPASPDSTIQRFNDSTPPSVVENTSEQNRKFPDKNTPGSISGHSTSTT